MMPLKELLTLHWKYEIAWGGDADGHTATWGYVVVLFGWNLRISPTYAGLVAQHFRSGLI
jgi:hypothetical protein